MKIKIYLKLFIFFFTIIFSNLTLAFETSVAEKYSEIFTNNILSQSDIENYREAYNFQEQCKWKSANKHILKICLLYTSPSPRDLSTSRMPSSA